jgi:hypothetical protein
MNDQAEVPSLGTSAEPIKSQEQDKVGIKRSKAEARHQHPQVMRFCPSLSTSELDISVSGKSQL